MSQPAVTAFALEQHLFFWMTQVIEARDRQLADRLRGAGLRAPEWRVLASLHARQRLSMRELADLSSIDRTTLSRTVERMARAGWLARQEDSADLRVIRLALTTAGERLFARVWPTVERLNQAAVAGLPAPAVEMLRWTLEQMKTNLDLVTDESAQAA